MTIALATGEPMMLLDRQSSLLLLWLQCVETLLDAKAPKVSRLSPRPGLLDPGNLIPKNLKTLKPRTLIEPL